MDPSLVPSFVPLKGFIGTLSSFGDLFFVKGFRIGGDLRNCIQNSGNNFEANNLNRYYPREILMLEIHFLYVLRRNVINKYHVV